MDFASLAALGELWAPKLNPSSRVASALGAAKTAAQAAAASAVAALSPKKRQHPESPESETAPSKAARVDAPASQAGTALPGGGVYEVQTTKVASVRAHISWLSILFATVRCPPQSLCQRLDSKMI